MVYNVSTWEDFIRAFTSTHDPSDPENDVIEILVDMDLNDFTANNPIYAGANKTINGNNHTIYNLHDGRVSGSPIFRNGDGNTHTVYNVTWNKLNFDNMFIIMGSYGAFWGMNTSYMIFNDCTFVGKCAEMFRFCELNRCAVTYETLQTNNTPFQYVNSNFCWYKVLIRKTATVNNTVMMGKMDTCYIEGKILCPASSAGVLGNLTNCCVNVQSDVSMNKISSNSNTPLSVYNSDKIPTVSTADVNMIAVTDAQMKDAQYLDSIGFAIIAQAGE